MWFSFILSFAITINTSNNTPSMSMKLLFFEKNSEPVIEPRKKMAHKKSVFDIGPDESNFRLSHF